LLVMNSILIGTTPSYLKRLNNLCTIPKEKVRDATAKANLMRWISQEETETLSFMKTGDNGEIAYILQTIKTRGSDDHHIVVGIRQEYAKGHL